MVIISPSKDTGFGGALKQENKNPEKCYGIEEAFPP
jgi:hypothetical protein